MLFDLIAGPCGGDLIYVSSSYALGAHQILPPRPSQRLYPLAYLFSFKIQGAYIAFRFSRKLEKEKAERARQLEEEKDERIRQLELEKLELMRRLNDEKEVEEKEEELRQELYGGKLPAGSIKEAIMRYGGRPSFEREVADYRDKMRGFDEKRLSPWIVRVLVFLRLKKAISYLSNEGYSLANSPLEKAKLRGIDLEGADLCEANLGGADLRGDNLEWAVLDGANLEGAVFDGAIMPDGDEYDPEEHTIEELTAKQR